MNNKHYIGRKTKSVTVGIKQPPISKVILNGDSDTFFVAGDDTGRVLETFVPSATQQMANDILQKVKGFRYQGYVANNAFIPPTVELGDGVTVGGVYGVLASREYSFTPKMTETVSAPYQSEEDHEYSYEGNYAQSIKDKVQLGQLYYGTRISRKNGIEIVKTDGETEKSRVILNSDLLAFYNDDGQEAFYYDPATGVFRLTQYANVEDAVEGSQAYSKLELTASKLQLEINDAKGNISTLQQTASSLQSQITNNSGDISSLQQTANSLQSQITSAEGDISAVEQYAKSIRLSVSNGYEESTIKLTASGLELSSGTVKFTGAVTFQDLSTAGATTINGSNIKTGTIDANRINLTGSISFSDLDSDVRNDINDAYTIATDVDGTLGSMTITSGRKTYIDGESVWTDTLYATKIKGEIVYLLDEYEDYCGYIYIRGANSSNYAVELASDSSLSLVAIDTLYLEGGDTHITMQNGITTFGGDGIGSGGSGVSSCGTSRYMWNDVWATNATIQTSDRSEKTDIVYGLSEYDTLFDKLRPCTFRFKNGSRIHQGMIAQDVETSMQECSIDSMDMAALIKFSKEDGEGYALRYTEFIPTLIWQVQQLKRRVAELEESIK